MTEYESTFKAMIIKWLIKQDDFITISDLYLLMRRNNERISYSTVRRYVKKLQEEGVLLTKETEGKSFHFRYKKQKLS